MPGIPNERKVEILEAFMDDKYSGLISVRTPSEGVLLYEHGASRVGGEPAIEIPHDDPYLCERPPKTFETLLEEYGLQAEVVSNITYLTVPDNFGSKRP